MADIRIGVGNWSTAEYLSKSLGLMLQYGYGYSVEFVPVTSDDTATQLNENSVDLVVEWWSDYSEVDVEPEGITVLSSTFESNANEGWWIPKYLSESYDLTSIDDLIENPESVGYEFHNSPVSWKAWQTNVDLITSLELEDYLNIISHESDASLRESISSAFANESGWLGYYWEPSPIFAEYDLVRVEVDFDAEQDYFPSRPVVNVAESEFTVEHPRVSDLLENFTLPNWLVSQMALDLEQQNKSIAQLSVDLIVDNANVFLDMMDGAARNNLIQFAEEQGVPLIPIESIPVEGQGDEDLIPTPELEESTEDSAASVETYSLTVIAQVFGEVLLLRGLEETISPDAHVIYYNGAQFDFEEVDAILTTVVRDGEFTAEFESEISDAFPDSAGISYSTAVSLIGVAGIDDAILMVAGADGNYVG